MELDEDTSLDNAIDLWNYASDAETPDENLIFTILSVTEPDVGVTIDSNRYIDVQPTANWYGTSEVTIEVSDGELTDTDNFTITVNSVNNPPVASNLAISPSSPITTDDLVGSYDYYDLEGDPESGTEIRWYKDSVLQSAYNDMLTVPSSATAKGEAWYFTVKPKDGMDFGDLQASPTVVIGDSPPTAPVVDVTPDSHLTTDDLTCTVTSPSTDPDGDTVSYTYEWYKNDVLQPSLATTTTELSVTIDSSNTNKGEVWKCVVTPHGSDGPPDEDEVTIQNSPPVLDTIGNKTVDEETELSFTAKASDPDLEPLIFSLGTGAPAGASITSGGYFTWTPTEAQGPGDHVIRIIVSDGTAEDYEDITVTVNEVNLPPVLNPIGAKTVSEGVLL